MTVSPKRGGKGEEEWEICCEPSKDEFGILGGGFRINVSILMAIFFARNSKEGGEGVFFRILQVSKN